MEVDTGAAVSLAPESVVSSLLSTTPLLPSSIILKTYTGEQIHVKGLLTVEVKYGQQVFDWRAVARVSSPTVSAVLEDQI